MGSTNITVSYTGVLNIQKIPSGAEFSVPDGTTISELLSMLDIIESHKKYVIVLVQDQKVNLAYKLKNSDEVKLSLLIGGG